MKKTNFLLFAILLTVLFAACSSDKDKEGEGHFSLKKTEEYIEYGSESFGYVGDVKRVTKTPYDVTSDENGVIIKNAENNKILTTTFFEFNQAGFLTKRERYSKRLNEEAKLEFVREVKYDEKHRV